MSLFLILGLLAYAAGSIPLHRFLGLSDFDAAPGLRPYLRSVLRFVLNVVKGVIIVEIGSLYGPALALATAYGVCLGHNFPIWSTFRGGTGIGVILGALVAFDPSLGLFALVSWLTTYYVYQNPTLAAVVAALATPLLASVLVLPISPMDLLPMTALVLFRHWTAVLMALTPEPQETEDVFREL